MTPARSVALQPGMTHLQARQAVAAVWPCIVLQLYHGTPAFYKEGLPWAEDSYTSDDDVMRSPGLGVGVRSGHSGPAVLNGMDSPKELHTQIYTAFGLEVDFDCCYRQLRGTGRVNLRLLTLDEMQAAVEGMRVAFEAKHGRPPGVNDFFDSLSPGP